MMRRLATLAMLLLAAGVAGVAAQDRISQPANEPAAAEASPQSTLAIENPVAVFAYLLSQLPEHVQINPTENYFYLRFSHQGAPYAGNIRLAAADRDQGKVNF